MSKGTCARAHRGANAGGHRRPIGRPRAGSRVGVLVGLAAGLLAFAGTAGAVDSDGDGVDDAVDTCRLVAHAHQGDADGDGFGDPCDCDFDGDGFCTLSDFTAFLPDFVSGVDGGRGTDMDGDGSVTLADFNLFLAGFQSGTPGPGASGPLTPDARFAGVECDGALPTASCRVRLGPELVLEALREQLEIAGDALRVAGDVRIPALGDGFLWMLAASITVEEGPGPFGFDTLRGTATVSNDLGGFLADFPVEALTVDLGLDLGANIEADVPLQPDRHYLLLHARAGLELEFGRFAIEGPGGATTLLFDPSDPFFYVGAEVTNIPITTPSGVFVLSAGGGIGFSQQGLVPFEPATTAGIAALFPSFEGHSVFRATGSLPTCAGCPTLAVDGYAVRDLDPQEDGILVHVPPGVVVDTRLGINGTVGVEGTLGLLSLTMDLFDATAGYTYVDGEWSSFVGGRVQSQPEYFDLDLESGFTMVPAAGTAEMGVGVMLGSDPAQRFLRFESRRLLIGAPGVVAATGVEVDTFETDEFFFQTGGSGTFLGSTTSQQTVVGGVRSLETSDVELSFPATGVAELILRSRFEVGAEQLRQSTVWISPERIAQEGLLDMPNYTFVMYGEITRDGPLLQGTLDVPIPYSYPELEAVLEIAAAIDQREAEVASLQAEAGRQRETVESIQRELVPAQNALNAAYDYLTDQRDALQGHLDLIEEVEDRDCGCDCGTFDAICWGACGVCLSAKEAQLLYLRSLTGGYETAVDLARTGLLAAQGVVGRIQVRLEAARSALLLTEAGLDDALGALAQLYADRDALPRQDAVFDATVVLTLTDEDLVGSVGGDFQGTPIGAGSVHTDGAPRACFTPPVPGATETFCTLL